MLKYFQRGLETQENHRSQNQRYALIFSLMLYIWLNINSQQSAGYLQPSSLDPFEMHGHVYKPGIWKRTGQTPKSHLNLSYSSRLISGLTLCL